MSRCGPPPPADSDFKRYVIDQEIALLLSGERAPPRELVKLAAARYGLAILKSADLQAIQDSGDFHKGYSAKRQPWRPDTKSSLTSKYKKRVDKFLGYEDNEDSE